MPNQHTQIAVTGIGIICANGNSVEQFWRNIVAGNSGIKPIRAVDMTHIAATVGGEVGDYKAEHYFNEDECKRMDRAGQFAVIAAREAVKHSQLELKAFDSYRTGIVLGTSLGGMRSGELFHEQWIRDGLEQTDEELLFMYPIHTPCDNIAHDLGLKGPRSVISNACAAGTNAIGYACDMIRMGAADVMLAGGVDPLTRLSYSGFNSLQALSPTACAPYSKSDGLNLGEGAAILVLERMDVALQRGATIIAEVLDYELSADAYHLTAPDPGGAGALRSMKGALRKAGLSEHDVDYINGHGTGTPTNDTSEPKALRALMTAGSIPVSSSKSMVGHMLGAAGAAEAVASVLAIENSFIPPTVNFDVQSQKFDIDFVPNAGRSADLNVILSNSFAFGGNNATVLFGKHKKCEVRIQEQVPEVTQEQAHEQAREQAHEQARGQAQVQDAEESAHFPKKRHKVVITGVGAIAGNAANLEQIYSLLREHQSGLSPISSFDTSGYIQREAGQIPELRYSKMINPSLLRKMDTLSKQATAVTKMALEDAKLSVTRHNSEQIGVLFATGSGPIETVESFNRVVLQEGAKMANAKLFPNTVMNAAAGHICIHFNIKGPTSTIAAGGVSIVNALFYANAMIQSGSCQTVLVVSSDEFNEPMLAGHQRLSGFLTPTTMRPFDEQRNGVVLGSGSVCFVVESEAAALARGARIVAELKGFGMTSDCRAIGGVNPRGQEWSAAFQKALADANMSAEQIDYVAAAANGHRMFDYAEAQALERVFGGDVPVSAPKSMFGETHGTAGGIGLLTALYAMNESAIPGIQHLNEPLRSVKVDFVTESLRKAKVDHALISSFAYGGNYNALVVGKYNGDAECSP
ncbi:beta-ketoacyl-[acyl-carrier-protein] synthase family protein [Paenibacillus sp. 481]|uniref:beta-ketoacyl-[acyl-carrier-protein] synthase family protein n=1 Tax=Paenibacillus sp. 481 TaxID=2835869 RepID=UPI001E2E1122|nr:beta-ketoacyl-[acyl-carrier-protein] synthase family protein [Paenibacillus sp. 481]UHA75642.1 beta-ketoacyl-[acyl-carrier-protein] synthase family protein [Paenibacillus sp. 481]